MSKVTLGYLNISPQGRRYVLDAVESNRLSRGKYTALLERHFASLHQCKHSVFCNSGTSALQISLAALRERYSYQDEDEVLVPAPTFVATSNVVLQNNLRPVFVDVDPRTFNMDPNQAEEKITSRTRVILPVHLFGLPCDMDPILALAEHYHLQIIEDSAETMFAHYRERAVGSFGDLGCFSTYIAHLLVGGVGGFVTTSDDCLATLCRSLMAHGRDQIYLNIDDDDEIDDPALEQVVKRRYRFDRIGYSFRATELEAAIALSELERWEEIIGRRRKNASYLSARLRPLEEYLQLPTIPAGVEHSFMMYPLVAHDHVDRDSLVTHLERQGIETRYMFPLLSQPIYRRLFPGLEHQYPVAQRLASQGFFVGIHQGLMEQDLEFVAEACTQFFRSSGAVCRNLTDACRTMGRRNGNGRAQRLPFFSSCFRLRW